MSRIYTRCLLVFAVSQLLFASVAAPIGPSEWDPVSVGAAVGSWTVSVMFQPDEGGDRNDDNSIGNGGTGEGELSFSTPDECGVSETANSRRGGAIVLEYSDIDESTASEGPVDVELLSAGYKRTLLALGGDDNFRLSAGFGLDYDLNSSQFGSYVNLGVDIGLTPMAARSVDGIELPPKTYNPFIHKKKRYHVRLEINAGHHRLELGPDFFHTKIGLRLHFRRKKPPIAVIDDLKLTESSKKSIHLAANDIDFDGDLVLSTTKIIAGPSNGTKTLEADQLTYTPNLGFIGSDKLIYEICDKTNKCDQALVCIKVLPSTTQLTGNQRRIRHRSSIAIAEPTTEPSL